MTTHQFHHSRRFNMKKIIVATLIVVGLGSIVTFVAKNYID